jgi:hypothetical protein
MIKMKYRMRKGYKAWLWVLYVMVFIFVANAILIEIAKQILRGVS